MDGDGRVEAVREAAALLWPEPTRLRWGRPGDDTPAGWRTFEQLAMLPYRPALLPMNHLAGARMLLATATTGLPPRRRAVRLAMAASWAMGFAQPCCRQRLFLDLPARCGPSSAGITALVSEVVARPVTIGLAVGHRRVNRKPVLYAFDERGRLLAYCKLGINALTRATAAVEAGTLIQLGERGLQRITIPRLLYYSPLHGRTLLVVSALNVPTLGRRAPTKWLVPAMLELAGVSGLVTESLADGQWWAAIRSRLARLGAKPIETRLKRLLDVVETAAGRRSLTFGRWHGDWTRWNMATCQDKVSLWDFERSAPCVPLGLDAIHHAVHTTLEQSQVNIASQLLAALAGPATQAAARFDDQQGPISLVVTAYLIEMACRALSDAAIIPSEWVEHRAASLVDALEVQIARVC